MSARKSQDLNLLPKTEFELSFWGRFLKWALSTGRYIIILTELAVIIAFISRFKLDHDLSDLGDSIGGKQALLEASSNTEKTLRLTQVRLDEADKKIKSQSQSAQVLQKVTTAFPQSAILTNFSLAGSNLDLTGITTSEEDLEKIYSDLSSNFKTVTLTNVSTDSNIGIKFTLKLWL